MDPKMLQQLIEKFGPQIPSQQPQQLPTQLSTAEEMNSPAAKTQQLLDTAASKASDVYDQVEAPRTKAIDIVAKQLDLNKQGDPNFREFAHTVLDKSLPNVADVALMGAGALAPKIIAGVEEFNKLGSLKNEFGALDATGNTLKELKKGNVAADVLARTGPNNPIVVPSMADLLAEKEAIKGRARLAAKIAAGK